ncbi:MAG: hypothetical protein WAK17_20450 [Candidatus Nitrosopolaris sp.]
MKDDDIFLFSGSVLVGYFELMLLDGLDHHAKKREPQPSRHKIFQNMGHM